MIVASNVKEYQDELQDLCNFFGDENIEITLNETREGQKIQDNFNVIYNNQNKEYNFAYSIDDELDELRDKSLRKRKIKNFLYLILSNLLNKKLVWGSLTGIRPTKFARTLIQAGEVKEHLVTEALEKDYYVSESKAKLTFMILKNQKCIIKNDNLVDLYINIPICPTRCLYCSFISHEISAVQNKVEKYIDCLIKELGAVKDIVKKKAYIIRTIYIGGGTPSVLTDKQLDRLLNSVNFPVDEFTVECGRPDTITAEKLDVLKKHKVTRISINPQTFCEATLKRIGRKHKNSQVIEAYSLALERGFKVNMDVIAGLPGEKFGTFKRTITTLLELYPDNITVHTLSIKRGSLLQKENDIIGTCDEESIEKMIDYAQKILIDNGYKPYYIYRQKHQLGGLENVGYYRDDGICIFNIDSMEETNSIIGVGAGAMSKRVFNLDNRLEREYNCKFLDDYINRIDEAIEKKINFFS